jgi:thiamine kinase-like enzyme
MENEPTIPVLRDLKTDLNSSWLSQALGCNILSFSWKFLKRSPGCVILCYNVVSEAGSFPKTSIVIKCHDMDNKIRSTQVLSLMYERELYFYRNIAQLIELNSPVVYKTIQQSNEFYYVIMENLLEKWSSVRLMPDGALSGDDMKKSLSDIRKLHVKFWGNEQLLNAYPFFEKDVLYDQLQRILEFKESWKMVKVQLPMKAGWAFKTMNGFPENMQKLIDYLDYCAIDDNSLKYYKKANSILATRPFTLIHGDLNCSNFFFGKGDKSSEVCWIDWGMTRSGPVALDFLTLWSTISITKNKGICIRNIFFLLLIYHFLLS